MASHGQVRVPVEAVLNGFALPKQQVSALLGIVTERQRQDRLLLEGVIPYSCADPTVEDGKKLALLMEEVGEVAKEINEFAVADNLEGTLVASLLRIRRRQRDELLQVAAVAVGWCEVINAELAEFGLNEETPRG